jgi:hypothetical protein
MDTKNLFLYKIWQTERNDYDTYDSMVVAAYSEEEAKQIHPNRDYGGWSSYSRAWASSPDDVRAQLIGLAFKGIQPDEIVLASFNAG